LFFEQETIDLLKGGLERIRKPIVGGWQAFPEPKEGAPPRSILA